MCGLLACVILAPAAAAGDGAGTLARDAPAAAPSEPVSRGFARGEALSPVGGPAADEAPGPGRLPEYGPLGLTCAARFHADPAPGGTVRLRVEAPCLPGALVTVSHGALAVDMRLSQAGRIGIVFPAFEDHARFALHLPGGTTREAEARVPGAAGYERVVTMWDGPGALSVHAYEFGAGTGESGHVWRGAPRGAQAAEAGRGGFLLRLGNAGAPGTRHAEVYSFPAAAAARAGTVRIALSAPVTSATCGLPLEAATFQLGEGLPGAPVALRIRMPACGRGAGDLVLKNLARDLKIAAR